jgi:hypothetical protein
MGASFHLFASYAIEETDMQLRTIAVTAAALAGLAGCQTWGPTWSELSGSRYTVTDFNRFPVGINAVDAYTPGPVLGTRGDRYFKIDPGPHQLELSAINTSPNWVSGINRVNLPMTFEPCKRYYINAQFENRLLADWKPVIDHVEGIPGCNPTAKP